VLLQSATTEYASRVHTEGDAQVRTLEVFGVSADGSVAKDVISGHFSDREAVALAVHMFLDRPVVEVWEQDVLVARVGDGEPQSGAQRARIRLARRTPWIRSMARAGMGKFHRLHGELAAAVASGVVGAVTIVAPRWVEASTGLDIDRGSGVLEWAVTVAMLLAAIMAAVSARRYYRRLMAERDS
jgi:hypothetical protein